MAATKVTGDPQLDAIISQIHKKYSVENLITLGPSIEPVEALSTGSLGLDLALGIGGVPIGGIIEIYGLESSGKTSLALSIAKKYMDSGDGKWVLIIDLEHTIQLNFLKSMGIDPDKIIFSRPKTAEQAFQTMMDLVKTGTIGLVVLDSIDAAQTEAQLQKDLGSDIVGGISKLMARTMREFSKLCPETKTTAIFINQTKYNPGQMFGNPETTTGGTALRFYSSVRLKTVKGKPSPQTPNAYIARVNIVKNKVASPKNGEITFDFKYAVGVDPYSDLVNTAKDLGLLRFAGQGCKFMNPETNQEETLTKAGGQAGLISEIQKDAVLFIKIKEACYKVSDVPLPKPKTP